MARQKALRLYRNIGIIAHIDAGKTTTTERILYYTGRKHQIIDVHDTKEGKGSTTTDHLEQERKRTARVISGAPIVVMQMGDEPGQVPLRKLPRAVQKLRPQLTKAEVAEVSKRLTALGGMRLPMPKGIDPTRMRPDRRGLRGR